MSQATKRLGVVGGPHAASERARLLEYRRSEQVLVVAQDARAPLAEQVRLALEDAAFQVTPSTPHLSDTGGVIVLCDDDGLGEALHRLTFLMPGQAVYSNVIFVTEDPQRAGGLLAEGFRDIVRPEELVRAVESLLRGQAPLLLEHLRQEIEGPFFQEFVGSMKQRALLRLRLINECVDLIRECEFLSKKVRALEDRAFRASVDQLLVSAARTESYILQVYDQHSFSVERLPSFPKEEEPLAFPREREPRWKKRRQFLEDMTETMRAMGWVQHTARESAEALAGATPVNRERPLAGLREYLRTLEELLDKHKKEIEEIDVAVDPIVALQQRCLDRYHFGILPPGIAAPQYIASVIRSLAQPPAEIYLAWVIDLRDLRIKICSSVLEDIRRGLSENRSVG